MYNFDPYNVFLAIATWLMTASVLQGHICDLSLDNMCNSNMILTYSCEEKDTVTLETDTYSADLEMWLYFPPQACHEHNWNCCCELFMVMWFEVARRLSKVWFDYVLCAFYCGGAGGESTLRKLCLWAPRFTLNIPWNSPCQHSSSKSNIICQHAFHEPNEM